jgi:hypothetical protein
MMEAEGIARNPRAFAAEAVDFYLLMSSQCACFRSSVG